MSYEMVYGNTHRAPNGFVKLILKFFVKESVMGDKPYKKNGQTASSFLIKEQKYFEKEKARLISYIKKTQELGETNFEGKESLSFGKLSAVQWNTMFQKHLEHHANQFRI